jgi:hypothetical protein
VIEAAAKDTPKPGQHQKPFSTSIRFDVLPISPELAIEMQLNHPDWDDRATEPNAAAIDNALNLQPQSKQVSAISAPGDRLNRFKGEPEDQALLNQPAASAPAQNPEPALAFDQDLSDSAVATNLNLDADLGFDLDRNEPDLEQNSITSPLSADDPEDADLGSVVDPALDSGDPQTANMPELPSQLLSLNQSQFLIVADQVLQISGQIYVPGTIEINLKDPSDLSDLAHASLTIDHEAFATQPPFAFNCELPIPALVQSQVMIGSVRLHPSDLDLELASNRSSTHITEQPITVTYQSADILAEAAQATRTIADFAAVDPDPSNNYGSTENEAEINNLKPTNSPDPAAPTEPSTVAKPVSLPITSRSPISPQSPQDLAVVADLNPEQATQSVPDQPSQAPTAAAPAQANPRPLAIPELPLIARQDHEAKQRQAAATQNSPQPPTKIAAIDLPNLAQQPKVASKDATTPPPQSSNQKFENIWGVQPPAPNQSDPQADSAQPSLPKITKLQPQPDGDQAKLEQLQRSERSAQLDSLDPLDPGQQDDPLREFANPSSSSAAQSSQSASARSETAEPEAELRYEFEEDEPQYSFEDPHDYDDPAIAISSDALEFWEDAMRSQQPLSLADAPEELEELLDLPEISGVNKANQSDPAEQLPDSLDLERYQVEHELAQIADLNPEEDAAVLGAEQILADELESESGAKERVSLNLDRVPNLEQGNLSDLGSQGDPSTRIDRLTDLTPESEIDPIAQLEQPQKTESDLAQKSQSAQTQPTDKPSLGDRFLSKLHTLSLDHQDEGEQGGVENEQPEAGKQVIQNSSPANLEQSLPEAQADQEHSRNPAEQIAINQLELNPTDRNQVEPDLADLLAAGTDAAEMVPGGDRPAPTTGDLDDLFPSDEIDLAQVEGQAEQASEHSDPRLEQLSSELEQMLIDTDRRVQAINPDDHAAPSANPAKRSEPIEPSPIDSQTRQAQLSRSSEFNSELNSEFNEVVVDDPALMTNANQVKPRSNRDRQQISASQQHPDFANAVNQLITNPASPPAPQANAAQANTSNNSGTNVNIPRLAEHEPVPLPSLEIDDQAQELIAGVPVPVRVKLAAIAPRLAVKIWVKDCQTRALVDGPRWLMDFNPIEDGHQVASQTRITLPLGSMEVAFEAIAVEMLTQRESHKARLTRSVTPPNMGNPATIDFDLP